MAVGRKWRTRRPPASIAEFALAAIPQPHGPEAPLVLVRSKFAIARTPP